MENILKDLNEWTTLALLLDIEIAFDRVWSKVDLYAFILVLPIYTKKHGPFPRAYDFILVLDTLIKGVCCSSLIVPDSQL